MLNPLRKEEQEASSLLIPFLSLPILGLVNCPDGSHYNENGQAYQGFHFAPSCMRGGDTSCDTGDAP